MYANKFQLLKSQMSKREGESKSQTERNCNKFNNNYINYTKQTRESEYEFGGCSCP
jgi:hypothetical protein